MRKLRTSDIPNLCQVIKVLGIKERAREIAKNPTQDTWSVGFDLIWETISNISEETAPVIYNFLSGPFEIDAEAISNLELGELIDLIKELAKQNNLADFFKFAAGSSK